jgi:hypothetical protein
MEMTTGSYIGSQNNDTVFIDGNFNVSNVFTVSANGLTSFNNFTGGNPIPCIQIDPVNCTLILGSGASVVSAYDTMFVDSNLNIGNIFTINTINGYTTYCNISGSTFIPNLTIHNLSGSVFATGSTGYIVSNTQQSKNYKGYLTSVTGSTGAANTNRGIVTLSSAVNSIFINNNLVDNDTSVFTNIKSYTAGITSAPYVSGVTTNNGYFTIYLSTSIGVGQTLVLDWFIVN